MKPADVVLCVLFALGCYFGGLWARVYLIPTFFPGLVVQGGGLGASASRVSEVV